MTKHPGTATVPVVVVTKAAQVTKVHLERPVMAVARVTQKVLTTTIAHAVDEDDEGVVPSRKVRPELRVAAILAAAEVTLAELWAAVVVVVVVVVVVTAAAVVVAAVAVAGSLTEVREIAVVGAVAAVAAE